MGWFEDDVLFPKKHHSNSQNNLTEIPSSHQFVVNKRHISLNCPQWIRSFPFQISSLVCKFYPYTWYPFPHSIKAMWCAVDVFVVFIHSHPFLSNCYIAHGPKWPNTSTRMECVLFSVCRFVYLFSIYVRPFYFLVPNGRRPTTRQSQKEVKLGTGKLKMGTETNDSFVGVFRIWNSRLTHYEWIALNWWSIKTSSFQLFQVENIMVFCYVFLWTFCHSSWQRVLIYMFKPVSNTLVTTFNPIYSNTWRRYMIITFWQVYGKLYYFSVWRMPTESVGGLNFYNMKNRYVRPYV